MNFFFLNEEEKVKCLRRRVVLKINFHLKGSECIRAEFAVVSCSVALEQCNIVLGPAKIQHKNCLC